MIIEHGQAKDPAWKILQVENMEPRDTFDGMVKVLEKLSLEGWSLREAISYTVIRPESPLLRGVGVNSKRVEGQQRMIAYFGIGLVLHRSDLQRSKE